MKTHPLRTVHRFDRLAWGLLGLGLLWLGAAEAGRAATASAPDYMTYQGFLVDANGNPLATNTPANYPVNFRLFNAATAGSSVWSEFQIVTVDRGQFSVVLGEGTALGVEPRPALSQVFTNTAASDLFMEIQVSINGVTNTLAPRLRLVTSPFAFLASSANRLVAPNNGLTFLSYNAGSSRTEVNGNLAIGGTISGNGSGLTNLAVSGYTFAGEAITSGTINDGRLPVNIARRNTGNAFTSGNQTITGGNLGVGTLSPNFGLSLGSGANNTKLALYDNGANTAYGLGYQANQFRLHLDGQSGDRFSFLSDAAGTELATLTAGGRLGIGTNAPTQALHVVGNGAVSGTLTVGTNNLNVASSVESLRIIRGKVNANGTIGAGSGTGFVVTRSGVGDYRIDFGTAFSALPVVTANALREKGGSLDLNIDFGGGGNSTCLVRMTRFDGTGFALVDLDFTFIAIGPR